MGAIENIRRTSKAAQLSLALAAVLVGWIGLVRGWLS